MHKQTRLLRCAPSNMNPYAHALQITMQLSVPEANALRGQLKDTEEKLSICTSQVWESLTLVCFTTRDVCAERSVRQLALLCNHCDLLKPYS